MKCKDCGAALVPDEVALYRKLFNRGASAFLCLDCQADYLGVERANLEEVIERYHRTGACSLFAKN